MIVWEPEFFAALLWTHWVKPKGEAFTSVKMTRTMVDRHVSPSGLAKLYNNYYRNKP